GSGPGCDAFSDRCGIDVAVSADVRQNRSRSQVQDRMHGGAKGQGCSNDFITFSHAKGRERKMKRRRSGAERQSLGRTHIGFEVPLEPDGSLTRRQPTAAQGRDYLGDLFFANFRQTEWNVGRFGQSVSPASWRDRKSVV